MCYSCHGAVAGARWRAARLRRERKDTRSWRVNTYYGPCVLMSIKPIYMHTVVPVCVRLYDYPTQLRSCPCGIHCRHRRWRRICQSINSAFVPSCSEASPRWAWTTWAKGYGLRGSWYWVSGMGYRVLAGGQIAQVRPESCDILKIIAHTLVPSLRWFGMPKKQKKKKKKEAETMYWKTNGIGINFYLPARPCVCLCWPEEKQFLLHWKFA